jgi:hypothetical protein
VHVYPVVAAIFAREMQKIGVKGTRMCIQDSLQASATASSDCTPFHIQIALEASDAQRHFTEYGLIWPPAFSGFNLFGCSDVRVMADEVNAAFATSHVVELMCHVGLRGQRGTGFGPDDVCTACSCCVTPCV